MAIAHPSQRIIARSACWFCGAGAVLRARVVPMARGGSSTSPDNFVRACRSCANLKGIMTIGEFREVVRRTLVRQDYLGPRDRFRFVGEGGVPWTIALRNPGLRRSGAPCKPVELAGDTCWCGKWIPLSKLEKHFKNCPVARRR